MLVVIAVLGLAVDVGSIRYDQHKLQSAAEAVALAGALEVTPCNGDERTVPRWWPQANRPSLRTALPPLRW